MKHEESAELRQARQRVDAWRREYGGPGSAVPETVWEAAVTAAKKEGVCRTAKVLRLNSARLKARTEGNPGAARAVVRAGGKGAVRAPVQQATFVDVGLSQLSGPKTIVELCNRGGDRMRIEIEATVDVVALAQSMIGARR